MDDWNKILVYGSFDGFAYSTDDFPLISVVLGGGEKAEIPAEFVVSADQMVNKNKIKLKDVIARIQMFDLETKVVWLNEILNELGSDYGTLKYKAGYDQGKFEGEWFGKQLEEADKVRQELNKPVVPQFVADWLKYCKRTGVDLYHALEMGDLYFCNYANQKDDLKLKDFFETENNQELFARAWLDGYTVEKEKRYTVKIKGISEKDCYLRLGRNTSLWFFGGFACDGSCEQTRKELEEAGFGEVFNSPLFEVEEVKE